MPTCDRVTGNQITVAQRMSDEGQLLSDSPLEQQEFVSGALEYKTTGVLNTCRCHLVLQVASKDKTAYIKISINFNNLLFEFVATF